MWKTANARAGIITGFYQAEAERRAATGNPGPGGNAQGGPKKPKFESPADIKKRLAEHKARKAELAANGGSGGNTPLAETPIDSPGAFVSRPLPVFVCTIAQLDSYLVP